MGQHSHRWLLAYSSSYRYVFQKSSLFCLCHSPPFGKGVLPEESNLLTWYTLLVLVWPCPSWWSYWKLRQLCTTVLQQFLTWPADDPSCNRCHHRPLRQPKYYICVQCREQRSRYGLLKHSNNNTSTCRCLLYVIYKIITMSDVSIHTHIPIIGKQYDLRMREKKNNVGSIANRNTV